MKTLFFCWKYKTYLVLFLLLFVCFLTVKRDLLVFPGNRRKRNLRYGGSQAEGKSLLSSDTQEDKLMGGQLWWMVTRPCALHLVVYGRDFLLPQNVSIFLNSAP